MADFTPNLGEVPSEDARRDAVHVAVAPVVAASDLEPGDRVWHHHADHFGSWNLESSRDAAGVADPFRKESIKAGTRFWLFLYPGTITSLRHVWTHPAFKPKLPKESS